MSIRQHCGAAESARRHDSAIVLDVQSVLSLIVIGEE
jgi:hypothetical protein